jgi:hypothetical protein
MKFFGGVTMRIFLRLWNLSNGVVRAFKSSFNGDHPLEYLMVLGSSNILIFDLCPKIQEHYL